MTDETRSDDSLVTKKTGGVLKTLAILFIILLAGVSGFQYWVLTQKSVAIESLAAQKTAVELEQQRLNGVVDEMTATFNEVAEKLSSVRKNEVAISDLVSRADETNQKSMLLDDIATIEKQLQKDKSDLAQLTARMKQSSLRIKQLEDLVASLRKDIDSNTKMIADLRSTIEQKDTVIRTTQAVLRSTEDNLQEVKGRLDQTSQELETTRETLVETRNTAYYTVGTAKDLKTNGLISENGWFFQKKVQTLAADIDASQFTRIDITDQTEFPVSCPAKDVKLVPSRPEASYTIEETAEDAAVVKVVNPDKFWQIRHLAIVVK
jgi:uncharacterized protein (DUF3084 family)